jgi:hypothetical protein
MIAASFVRTTTRTWNVLGPTRDIVVFIFPNLVLTIHIQQFGHEKRSEKVTALAIAIFTTHLLVPIREHEEEIVNHFVIQPLQEKEEKKQSECMSGYRCTTT